MSTEKIVMSAEGNALLQAAEKGDTGAQYMLGDCYLSGKGVKKNEEEAVKWFTKAAEQSFLLAQIGLDRITKIREARQGDADAQYKVGDFYYLGDGVEKNEAEAVKWYTKAAEQGHIDAQYELGDCYFFGKGVEKNEEEAVKWYTKAAEQGSHFAQYRLDEIAKIREAEKGNADAQVELGKCYLYGDCVEKNEAEAVKWFTKAADQGHADAQYWIGYCYFFGKGVGKNEAEAVKWFTKAAEQGHFMAQTMLGNFYLNGVGVGKNEAEAVKWFTKAAEQGHTEAQEMLSRLQ